MSVDELLKRMRKIDSSKLRKAPNCFIIYRTMWIECLKKEHTKLNLSEISTFIGTKWEHEPSKVKEFYKQLLA
ncbi:hypothetical protein RclHR1_03480002 [Rhizophagus clarus]|uniref:Mating-type protein MAT-2-like n=1 Tax=Rhizophagus clarus TaxID=94130 RepID=A0A2Z6S5C3_9GLOM|nr:hypothetical protein RclHR1_03480002 [Rhizophagus clarus]GES84542.1 mating-type protein MAT-2-like [Rhizophagus clarus]